MVAPVVSIQPSETPFVSDRASSEYGLSMESSDDIIPAVPREPTVAKSAVQPDPRPPVTGRNDDNSHHSLEGRKATVHRPGTSQLPWNCRGLGASGGNSELYYRSSFQPVLLYKRLTMLCDSTYSSSPGYRAFFSTPFLEQSYHGGTAILVRQDIPVVPLQLSSPLQVVAAFLG
ncbi:hypothetical protein E2C01_012494 [Portunus trituberculatus]|uniref:Uncharacterized protein n=1 Tax=Portunus trituberculatus TaxID=210409 RepID=A0A5B7DEQ8_PORTR|nr:hypothetical protein [Portunus trituberculatus]